MDWTQHLPSIVALISVVLTVIVNAVLGWVKARTDTKTGSITAESAFRDDLIESLDRCEGQIKLRDEKIDRRETQLAEMQNTAAKLIEEITTLRLDKKELEYALKEAKTELDRFNRKVYYIREEKKDEL